MMPSFFLSGMIPTPPLFIAMEEDEILEEFLKSLEKRKKQ